MPSAQPDAATFTCDVAVAGAGLGGVTAALVAAEQGKTVVLMEAANILGGTAAYSGGGIHIWSASTWEEYQKQCPNVDPLLGKTLVETYPRYVLWLINTKVPGSYGVLRTADLTLPKFQMGDSLLPKSKLNFFKHMTKKLNEAGCTVLYETKAKRLITDNGKVTGIVGESAGKEVTVNAKNVILATGGFQGGAKLLSQYVSPAGYESFINNGVVHNTGDGLRMAVDIGAKLSPRMDTIYGHLAPVCAVDRTKHIERLTADATYAQHCIAVNVRGERFVDEGASEHYGVTADIATKQPPGGIWLILDAIIRKNYARQELPPKALRPANLRYWKMMRFFRWRRDRKKVTTLLDFFALAKHRGATILHALTIEELAKQLEAHGVDAHGVKRTVDEFNAHIKGEAAPGLAVPRTTLAHPITTPPFYAIQVAPAISFTNGGLAINERAQVLDKNSAPIPGLYAVPGVAGGIFTTHYGGALASCGVFGMIAGKEVSRK